MSTLGFHHAHDLRELKKLLQDLGIELNLVIPQGASVQDLKHLGRAWFNVVPYRELGPMMARYLQEQFGTPYMEIAPMGVVETARFIRQIQQILNEQGIPVDYEPYIQAQTLHVSQAAWFSRSIDCQNLTGKKAVVFGDSTHAAAMTKILAREMGVHVVWAGSYCTYDGEWLQTEVGGYCDQVLLSEDHTRVADAIAQVEPAAIFGTQMERHVGKRLRIPCGVISAPMHVQDFPLGYWPFLGYEGANQIVDLIYNSFTLGMEDHLLEVFGGHDTNFTMRLRDWRPNGEVIAPLAYREQMAQEAQAELRFYLNDLTN